MMLQVVNVVLFRGTNILVTKRGPGGAFPFMWELPGGKMEDGETLEEALRREVMEEVGITELLRLSPLAKMEYNQPITRTDTLITTYIAVTTEIGEPRVGQLELRWVRIADLSGLQPQTPAVGVAYEILAAHGGLAQFT